MPGSRARSVRNKVGRMVMGQETSSRQGAASPWFARVAAELLKAGKADEALLVCLAGTRAFPRYMTGRLVLGRCFDALGRHIEAMLEYRHVIERFPDNPVVAALVKNAREREQQGFGAFREEHLARLHARKDRLTFEDYVGAREEPFRDSSVERILRELEDAPKRIVPSPEGDAAPPPPPPPEPAGRMVTATLAEIYASQGEYGEAIEAYRKLAEQRPGSAERYQRRLRELEDLRRTRDPDGPAPGG
jgi:tetratricopeptide (TPR) repeat protein